MTARPVIPGGGGVGGGIEEAPTGPKRYSAQGGNWFDSEDISLIPNSARDLNDSFWEGNTGKFGEALVEGSSLSNSPVTIVPADFYTFVIESSDGAGGARQILTIFSDQDTDTEMFVRQAGVLTDITSAPWNHMLDRVVADSTLTGDGTSGSPLSVQGLAPTYIGSFDANSATYPSPNAAANSTDGEPVIVFEQGENQIVRFRDSTSAAYSGSFTVDITHRADTATAGDITLGVSIKRQAAGDSTARSFAAQKTATVTTAGSAGDITLTSISFTDTEADSLAILNDFVLEVERTDNDMADDLQVLKVRIR